MNNRRGQIQLILIFLVALALIIAALIGFYNFDSNFGEYSKENSNLMGEVNFAEQYVIENIQRFAENSINCDVNIYGSEICSLGLKERFMGIANMGDVKYYGAGNFFGKIRSGGFIFVKEGEEYKIEIKDIFVVSKRGESEVVRKFDVLRFYKS